MSDFDDEARAAGERVRRDAERIAGTIEPFAPASESGPGRSSHWLLAAGGVEQTTDRRPGGVHSDLGEVRRAVGPPARSRIEPAVHAVRPAE